MLGKPPDFMRLISNHRNNLSPFSPRIKFTAKQVPSPEKRSKSCRPPNSFPDARVIGICKLMAWTLNRPKPGALEAGPGIREIPDFQGKSSNLATDGLEIVLQLYSALFLLNSLN